MNSHLKIIVLKTLDSKPMSGYDLVKDIHSTTQHWKPSFGSIYPLLKDLHGKGLVTVRVSGRKKLYTITPKGRQALKDIFKTKDKIYDITMNSLKGLESICSKKELEFVHKLHSNLRCNFMPFKEVTNEMQQLAEIIMNMSDANKISKNEKRIKSILNEAITKLEELK